MIRGLVLDLDNTLIDRDRAVRGALRALVDEASLPDLLALDARGRGPRAPLLQALARGPLGSVEAAWDALQRELTARIQPDPALLEALAVCSLPRVLLTNGGSRTQRAKLAAAGLTDAVGTILVSEEIGIAKPDPAAFRAAADALGLPFSELLMIGDDPVNDIAGAEAVGMQTCLVHPDGESRAVDADYRVATATEALRRWR